MNIKWLPLMGHQQLPEQPVCVDKLPFALCPLALSFILTSSFAAAFAFAFAFALATFVAHN